MLFSMAKRVIQLVMSGSQCNHDNSCTNVTNSIAKLTNCKLSTAKVTNSIANGTKSIAKVINSIAKTCKRLFPAQFMSPICKDIRPTNHTDLSNLSAFSSTKISCRTDILL